MNKKISLLLFITVYSLGDTCQIKAMDPINKENKKLVTELLLKQLSNPKPNLEDISKLIQQGADVNVKNDKGISLLHVAAARNNSRLAELLITNNAFVDVLNNEGFTPLNFACINGSMDVIRLLCENGANVDFRNNEGNSPLHTACLMGHLNVVDYLIDKGASINITDNELLTPLYIACVKGFFKIVESLIKKKANVTIKDYQGYTPLHFACFAKNPGSIITLLIKNGADVNAVAQGTLTPLHIAASQNNRLACRLLLENGADVSMATSDGMTALDIAYDLGYKDIITLLKTYDRQINAQVDAHMRAFFEELNQETISKKKKKKKKKAPIQQQAQPMIEIGPETNSTDFPELPSEIRTNEPITNPLLEEQPIKPTISAVETVIETSPTVSVVTQPTAPTPIQERPIKIITQKLISTHIAPASAPGNGYRILIGQNLKWPHLNKNQELLIKNNLLSLKNWPKHNLDIKKLKGEVNTHRLRVGNYRIIFSVDTERREIKIQKIGLRKKIYKQYKG